MKAAARMVMLHLVYWLRRWQLAHAREFRFGIERTIVFERLRAEVMVAESEVAERRAYAAIVAARADRRIPAEAV